MKKKIIILAGDPNSINTEIIYKSWKKLNYSLRKKLYILGSSKLIKEQFQTLNFKDSLLNTVNFEEKINKDKINIINIDLKYKDCFNVSEKASSKYILNSLNLAHNLALKKDVSGIINCPISKNLLNKKNIGVTEYLASKCRVKKNSEVMWIKSKNFSVIPLTTHIDVKNISKKITSNLIIAKVKTFNKYFKKINRKKPKIAILGLNPHNAELKNESEEKKIIIPSISKLKKKLINVSGPLAADTVFINSFKKFDVIIGMYHDQVLAPFKALYKFDAINVTLGLNYLRASPDHGVARNIVGKNIANDQSLTSCIHFINKF